MTRPSLLLLLTALVGSSEAFMQVAQPTHHRRLAVAPRFVADFRQKNNSNKSIQVSLESRWHPIKESLEHLGRNFHDHVLNNREEFLERSSVMAVRALETAARVAQGAHWLATNQASPMVPWKQAAGRIVVDHWEQVQQHLVAHGQASRRRLLQSASTWTKEAPRALPFWYLNPQQVLLSAHPELDDSAEQELFEKIASSSSTVVVDHDIMEFLHVAEQLEQEVHAQITLPYVDTQKQQAPETSEFLQQELLRAKIILQTNEVNKRASLAPKPTRKNNDDHDKPKHHLKTPILRTVDPELFQRKLLSRRLEMEAKQRHVANQEHFQRSLLQTRLDMLHKERIEARQKALDHLFLNEFQDSQKVVGIKEADDGQLLKAEKQQEHPMVELANASLGLTAPVDLLKDDVEMKKREVESIMAVDEKVQERKARAKQEQDELRRLVLQVQRSTMEKKERAKKAREGSTLPVIVAALSKDNARREVAKFDRSKTNRTCKTTFASTQEESPNATYFEQLNRQIRQKYEEEKVNKEIADKKQEGTFVVNKLERKTPSGITRALGRLVKRCLKPVTLVALVFVQFYFACVHGAPNKHLLSPSTLAKDTKVLQTVPGWKQLLETA